VQFNISNILSILLQVKVDFLHTWPRGKSYSWQSSNWGTDRNQITEPTEKIGEESDQTEHEDENLPNSQNWGIRNQAKVDNGFQEKHMKTSCIVCLKGKKKNEIWLKCGVRQCPRLNVHAKCNNIHVPNMDKDRLAKFCADHIRCKEHMGRSHLQAIPETMNHLSNSDAGSEIEEIILPENTKKVANLYQGVPGGLIGGDSDSDFAQSMLKSRKPRLILSTGKKGPKKSKKSPKNNQKSSPVPSTSGLSQARMSSPEFSDPISSKLVKYRYRKARSESESS